MTVKFAQDELNKTIATIEYYKTLVQSGKPESAYEIVTPDVMAWRTRHIEGLEARLPQLRVDLETAHLGAAKDADHKTELNALPANLRDKATAIVYAVLDGKQGIHTVYAQRKSAAEKGNTTFVAVYDWIICELDQPEYRCQECGTFNGRVQCAHCGGM